MFSCCTDYIFSNCTDDVFWHQWCFIKCRIVIDIYIYNLLFKNAPKAKHYFSTIEWEYSKKIIWMVIILIVNEKRHHKKYVNFYLAVTKVTKMAALMMFFSTDDTLWFEYGLNAIFWFFLCCHVNVCVLSTIFECYFVILVKLKLNSNWHWNSC